MDYKNLNDYELIYQVRENDEIAYGLLMDKYSKLVSMMAKKYLKLNRNIGLEYDDLYQEGMVGLIQALKDYNPNDTLFYTYVSLCAAREMDRIIKSQKRKKRMIFNNYISLNKMILDDSRNTVGDMIASDYNIEKEFENKEAIRKVIDSIFDFELIDSSILELKINGFSTREIASLLELSYKAVDYRMRKIRKKITKFSY